MPIALITATPLESKKIRQGIHPVAGDETKIVFEGRLGENDVIFTHCGIGKVNAAHSATLILENYDVSVLILFGIGGAYPDSDIRIGDIAVAKTENYAEEGVLTENGWRPMDILGFPLLKKEREYYNTFPLDDSMAKLAADASKNCGFNVRTGDFVTVSQCSGTRESGEMMRKRFNGLCENMEGAAIAHICALYGIRMIEIRGISNIIEYRDMKTWDIENAALNCNKAVIELTRNL